MRTATLAIVTGLALLLVPLAVTAGDGDRQGDEQKKTTMRQTAHQQDFVPKLHQADHLIGAEVLDTEGTELGKIADLVTDPERDGVRYVILSLGASSGTGEQPHAIPWSEFTLRDPGVEMDNPRVILDASEQELKAYTSAEMKADDLESRRVSTMLGQRVNDAGDARLGEIQDVIIDANKGHLAYAIVDVDDAARDMGETSLVAVPWTSLQTRDAPYALTMNAKTVQQMVHEEGSLALLETRETAEKRHAMARCEPYWTVVYWATLEPDDQARGDEPTRYGAMGNMTTVTGELNRLSSEMINGEEHLRLELITSDGKRYQVDAGLRQTGELDVSTFATGDEMTVSGVRQVLGSGETLVLASTIYTDGTMHEVERKEMRGERARMNMPHEH